MAGVFVQDDVHGSNQKATHTPRRQSIQHMINMFFSLFFTTISAYAILVCVYSEERAIGMRPIQITLTHTHTHEEHPFFVCTLVLWDVWYEKNNVYTISLMRNLYIISRLVEKRKHMKTEKHETCFVYITRMQHRCLSFSAFSTVHNRLYHLALCCILFAFTGVHGSKAGSNRTLR